VEPGFDYSDPLAVRAAENPDPAVKAVLARLDVSSVCQNHKCHKRLVAILFKRVYIDRKWVAFNCLYDTVIRSPSKFLLPECGGPRFDSLLEVI
jgi:hypothetical protein